MTDIHQEVFPPEAEMMERLRARLLAFIFPNTPRTDQEQAACERAALLQYEHEASLEMGLPQGVTQFRLGALEVKTEGAAGGRLTARNICPAAYGELLRAGLLYRGAEGRNGC